MWGTAQWGTAEWAAAGAVSGGGGGGSQNIGPGGIGPLLSLSAGPSVFETYHVGLLGIGPLLSMAAGPVLSGAPSTIGLTELGTLITLGVPTVRNVDITLGGIGPMISMGTGPTLSSATRWLFPGSIGPLLKLGPPSLSGGDTSMRVWVGGYDRTAWVRRGTAQFRSQTIGRWTGQITFEQTPSGDPAGTQWTPLVGQTFLITEASEIIFRGCIQTRDTSRQLATDLFETVATVGDKAAICDWRVVTGTYTADQDVADVIRDGVANYLNGEGILLDPDLPASLGALGISTQAMVTVTQMFDQLASIIGYQWYIDTNQTLIFVDPSSATAAPFSITETSKNWRNLQVTESIAGDYANRIYVTGSSVLSAGDGSSGSLSRTESYTLLDAGGGVGYQAQARAFAGFPLPDGFIVLELVPDSVQGVTVNGSAVAVYENTDPAYETFLNDTAFATQAFTYLSCSGQYIIPLLHLAPGDVVAVTYVPCSSNSTNSGGSPFTVSAPPSPPAGENFGTCGSGIIEHVEQVTQITTEDAAKSYGDALLAIMDQVPLTVKFQTDVPGLRVGQRLTANIPKAGLSSEALFITQIDFQPESSGMDLGSGSSFRWNVTAMNTPQRGNWKKWWERFYARTQVGAAATQTVVTQIILGAGSSLVAGTNFTNPGRLNVSGRLSKVTLKFQDPPTDQTVIIDVAINGVSIFDSQKARLTSGTSSEQTYTNFSQPVIYGFVGDYVTVSVTYSQTGNNPVNAKNGQMNLIWEV